MLLETNNPICLDCYYMRDGYGQEPDQPNVKIPLLFCLYAILSQQTFGISSDKKPPASCPHRYGQDVELDN